MNDIYSSVESLDKPRLTTGEIDDYIERLHECFNEELRPDRPTTPLMHFAPHILITRG